MLNAFQLYRRILRVNRQAFPISQLHQSNRIIKSQFYAVHDRFVKENMNESILMEAREQAENYINRIASMSSSQQVIKTHDPQYWEHLYANIWKDYRDRCESTGAGEQQQQQHKMPLFQYLEQREDVMMDWYADLSEIKDIILDSTKSQNGKVLVLGSGLSRLSVDLYKKLQLPNVCSIDISPSVVTMMRQVAEEMNLPVSEYNNEQIADLNGINFYTADARDLTSLLPAKSFDLVIDKATCDSLWLEDAYGSEEDERDSDSEKHEDKGEENLKRIQEQVYRVLKDRGIWLVFSNYDDLVFNATDKKYHMKVERGSYEGDEGETEPQMFIYRLTKKKKATKKTG